MVILFFSDKICMVGRQLVTTGQEKEGCVMRHGECMVLLEDDSRFEKVGIYQTA